MPTKTTAQGFPGDYDKDQLDAAHRKIAMHANNGVEPEQERRGQGPGEISMLPMERFAGGIVLNGYRSPGVAIDSGRMILGRMMPQPINAFPEVPPISNN